MCLFSSKKVNTDVTAAFGNRSCCGPERGHPPRVCEFLDDLFIVESKFFSLVVPNSSIYFYSEMDFAYISTLDIIHQWTLAVLRWKEHIGLELSEFRGNSTSA